MFAAHRFSLGRASNLTRCFSARARPEWGQERGLGVLRGHRAPVEFEASGSRTHSSPRGTGLFPTFGTGGCPVYAGTPADQRVGKVVPWDLSCGGFLPGTVPPDQIGFRASRSAQPTPSTSSSCLIR